MNSRVYVSGVPENSGPGDLLGAITNEAEVDGGKVGEIDIKGSIAIVSLQKEIVEPVVEKLENVAGKPVLVFEEDSDNLEVHFLKLAKLVEIEREEEMKRYEKEIKNF